MAKFGASAAEIKSHTGCTVTSDGDVINERTGKVLAKAEQIVPVKPQSTSEITTESHMQMMQTAFPAAQSGTLPVSTYTSKQISGATIGEMTLDEYIQTVQAAFAGNGTGGGNTALQAETSAGLENAMDDGYNEDDTGFADDETSDCIEAPYNGLYRRAENTGVFAVLPERMSKKHVRKVAKESGIDLEGLSLMIDMDADKLSDRCWFTGVADPDNIGRIILCPKAFISREALVRTIFHEKVHVVQYRQFGAKFVQNNREYFEQLADEAEDTFIVRLKKEGLL